MQIDKKRRMKRKYDREGLVKRIITLARLPAPQKRTIGTLTRGQLVELEFYLRRTQEIISDITPQIDATPEAVQMNLFDQAEVPTK